jgi:hypothetical protein
MGSRQYYQFGLPGTDVNSTCSIGHETSHSIDYFLNGSQIWFHIMYISEYFDNLVDYDPNSAYLAITTEIQARAVSDTIRYYLMVGYLTGFELSPAELLAYYLGRYQRYRTMYILG